MTAVALVARATLPTHTDPLAKGETVHPLSYRGDGADDFMTGHKWVHGKPKIVINQVHIPWQNPQCVMASSTSSGPSGPGS
ncbi:MAG TPA: hypothetical protein VN648_07720 [Candidatus Methylomirabilis sp.]|nr:hypothetical protein [Candidatus Methylomirabilis sp.]